MEFLTMTAAELERIGLVQQTCKGQLRQTDAAALAISVRQLRRLMRAFQRDGPTTLISKRRGKAPKNGADHAATYAGLSYTIDRRPSQSALIRETVAISSTTAKATIWTSTASKWTQSRALGKRVYGVFGSYGARWF